MMRKLSPRQILIATEVAFLVYAFPGFVGWDTEASLLQARSGYYSDGHPPAIAALWRLVEVFLAGPLGMLLIQSLTLLCGLYYLFAHWMPARRAAIAAAIVFLFPPISGVTGIIVKDALMAGFAVLGFAFLLDDRKRRQWIGLALLVAASAMRWNALAATFAPIVLLFRVGTGWRRYAIAIAVWLGVTLAAMGLNEALTSRHAHLWSKTHALMDIAGTLEYVDDLDDATLSRIFDGTPLVPHEHIHEHFRDKYDAADYRQLIWGYDKVFDAPLEEPMPESQQLAIGRAWDELVLGHPVAYLHYRWDNFKILMRLDVPYTISQVYVWFHIIAEPYSVDWLDHDATASKIQAVLIAIGIWISNTPLYYPFWYLALCFVLLPICRRDRNAIAFLLSGIGYQLAWFFLDPTGDFRYSQWMIVALALAIVSRQSTKTTAPSAQRAASQATIA